MILIKKRAELNISMMESVDGAEAGERVILSAGIHSVQILELSGIGRGEAASFTGDFGRLS